MNLDCYQHLWESGRWCLERLWPRPEDTGPVYLIRNVEHGSYFVIEEDEVAQAVKQEMLRRGVRVLEPDEL